MWSASGATGDVECIGARIGAGEYSDPGQRGAVMKGTALRVQRPDVSGGKRIVRHRVMLAHDARS